MNYKKSLENAHLRLRNTIEEMLKFYIDLLTDLNQCQVTSVNLASLNIAASAIRALSPETLFKSFIGTRKFWPDVNSQNPKTLEKVLQLAYEDGVVDVSLFMIPFECLENLEKDPRYRGLEKDDWPITSEDISVIWDYLVAIVKICTNIVHIKRQPTSDEEPFNYQRKYLNKLNLVELSTILKFKLTV